MKKSFVSKIYNLDLTEMFQFLTKATFVSGKCRSEARISKKVLQSGYDLLRRCDIKHKNKKRPSQVIQFLGSVSYKKVMYSIL